MSKPTGKGISSALSTKVSKILQMDLESDKETADALRNLSRILPENTPDGRRNLRGEIEKSVISCAEEFLEYFTGLKKRLDTLHSEATVVEQSIAKMHGKVSQVQDQNASFILELNEIQNKLLSLDQRVILVDEFLNKYRLTPREELIIKDSAIAVNESFFTALSSLNQIHTASSELMIESAGSRVAIDVMDYSSRLMEVAVEKLYRWTLTTVRSSLDGNDINLVMESLKIMQLQKPQLFDQCLEEYSTLRRSIIARNMVKACTRPSSPNSSGMNRKPMDFYANDSVKYITDLFSWTHQALMNEKQILGQILSLCDQGKLNERAIVTKVLSVIADAIVNPLKSRIESTVISDYNSSLGKNSMHVLSLYNVKSIIHYYKNKLNGLLNNESPFLFSLEELKQLAYKMYLNALSSHSGNLGKVVDSNLGELATFELPPENLGPTDSLLLTVNLVQKLFAAYSTSPVKSESENDLKEIVDILLDPLIKCIKLAGSKLSNGEHSAVFELNSLDTLSCVIEPMDLLADAFDCLLSQIESLIDCLIKINVSVLLNNLGLNSVYDACSTGGERGRIGPLSNLDGCDILSLSKCSSAIDSFLAVPESGYFTSFQLITNNIYKERIGRESRRTFASIYAQIYNCIHEEKSGFTKEEADSLFPRQPEQVKALLQVE